MKHPFILILFTVFLWIPLGAWENEEGYRNELNMARSAVLRGEARVLKSEQAVVNQQAGIKKRQVEIRKFNSQKARVNEWIEVKSRAKELVSRQLKRKIIRLEEDLQKAVDARRAEWQLNNIQRRTIAYRKSLKEILARYGYTQQIQKLKSKRQGLITQIKDAQSALREPIRDLERGTQQLENEKSTLLLAEEKLTELLLGVPEKFKKIAPPTLVEVKVSRSGTIIYQASWIEAEIEADRRIRILNEAITAQKKEILKHKDSIDDLSDNILVQNAKCNEWMEKYRDALWWQSMESIFVLTVNSAINIALDFKSMGPYAFLVEAGDVAYKTYQGKLTANYGLPKGTYSSKSIQAVGLDNVKSQLWSKVSTKTLIKDTLKDTIKQLSGGKKLADGVSPRNLGQEWLAGTIKKGPMTQSIRSIGDVKNLLRWKYLLRAKGAFQAEVISQYGGIGKFWKTAKGKLAKAFKPSELGKLGVKIGVGIVKDISLSQSERKRMQSWYQYAAADALREVMVKNLKIIGATREFDTVALNAMQELMFEFIAERDEARHQQTLEIQTDKKIDPEQTYQFELAFSNENILVEKVTLGGLVIQQQQQMGRFWTGKLKLGDLPPSGEIVVIAKDIDSEKQLDDPQTKAIYNATKAHWQGYEPQADTYHRLRLGSQLPLRSFVFLIDCSGSMDENQRMKKAIDGANKLLNSGKFKERDELSLWVFYAGRIIKTVGFTMDHQKVKEAINHLGTGGGTPLARAIVESGEYLHAVGRGKYKALLILTDGQAQGVGKAIRRIKNLKIKPIIRVR